MPDVKIKGYSGAELEYQDVPKVYLAAPESTAENPVLVPFSYGDVVEGTEIIPDFAAGDMTVSVPDGYLLRSGVIKKPEALIPENIAEGVDIAGIVGKFVGGSNVKIQILNHTWSSSAKTIEHNLGVIPDVIIFVANANSPTVTSVRNMSLFGISEKMYNKYPTLPKKVITLSNNSNKPSTTHYDNTIEKADGNCIYSVTNSSFKISYALPGTVILISGLA